MSEMELRGKSIEALKAFNNAIVMSKLYPPEAPQLANAIDRGYERVTKFVNEYEPLVFSFKEDDFVLCGQVLTEETLSSFANLVIYRQLNALEMAKLVLHKAMDRFAFTQFLSLFNSSVAKIKAEGGGAAYITSLGLASFFEEDADEEPEDEAKVDSEAEARKVIKVRPELVDWLLGRSQNETLQQEVLHELNGENGVELVVACTGKVLKEISAAKKIMASTSFTTMLDNVGGLVDETKKVALVSGYSKLVLENLKEPAIMVLFCQNFAGTFGATVFGSLLQTIAVEMFGAVVVRLQQHLERIVDGNRPSDQYRVIKETLEKLQASQKWRQFEGMETAKNLLAKGEKERRKKRLESGLQSLLQGNYSVLNSDEFLEYLPKAVVKMITVKADDMVKAVVARLAKLFEERKGTDKLAKSLGDIGWKIFDHGGWQPMAIIVPALLQYVRQTKEVSPTLEEILELLQLVMQKSWHLRSYNLGDSIVVLFHNIRSGKLKKAPEFVSLVAKVQDKGIQRTLFPQFLSACLASPQDDTLAYRLIYQGPVAIRYLIDALIGAEREEERFKLMDMLTSDSGFVADIVLQRLPELMPWFGKRNLIKLLGETGREKDAAKVLSYLYHEDFRVQKEALICIYKIGGTKRKELLLEALPEATEEIKIKIIQLLGTMVDEEVTETLGQLLGQAHEIGEKNRNEYVTMVLETLGHCPYPEAVRSIENFMASRGGKQGKKISENVWQIGAKIQKFLQADLNESKRKQMHAGQLRKNVMRQVARVKRDGKIARTITGLPEEQNIKSLVASGDVDLAKEEILELIERTAKNRNFVQADQLREWLIEIDSSAYSEIIQAAEIIDAEKASAIDKDHLEIWSRLYDALSTEEFSAIYHALIHRHFLDGEQITSQGEVQSSLYLINSGRVRVFYADGTGTMQLKTMGKGEILGADSFFEPSVWTVSAASVGKTDISILKLDRLNRWCAEYPGLETRLRDFCRQFEDIGKLIQNEERERRSASRYTVTGRLTSSLVDDRAQSLGINTSGDVVDISEGGISWLLHIPNRNNSRLLLGRKVKMRLPVDDGSSDHFLLTGDIMAVRSTWAADGEYSVHVKFDQPMPQPRLQSIITAFRSETIPK